MIQKIKRFPRFQLCIKTMNLAPNSVVVFIYIFEKIVHTRGSVIIEETGGIFCCVVDEQR